MTVVILNCTEEKSLFIYLTFSRVILNLILMVIQRGTDRQAGREIGRSVINTNKPDQHQSLFCVLIYLFNNCCTMVWLIAVVCSLKYL